LEFFTSVKLVMMSFLSLMTLLAATNTSLALLLRPAVVMVASTLTVVSSPSTMAGRT